MGEGGQGGVGREESVELGWVCWENAIWGKLWELVTQESAWRKSTPGRGISRAKALRRKLAWDSGETARRSVSWNRVSKVEPGCRVMWGLVGVVRTLVAQLLSHILHFATHGLQLIRLPHPSVSPGACSDSSLLCRWCYLTISSSATPFSVCLQFFSAAGSFPVSLLFISGGQSIGVSASAPVLPVNIQDWSPLGWAGWISLQSKGLSRVFSNTTVQKHQFFSTQPSSWSRSHIHTWLLENHNFD